jgi:hypothetical protein
MLIIFFKKPYVCWMLVVPWNLSTWFKQHIKLSKLFINKMFNTSIHLKLCTGGCWLVLSRTGQDMPTVLANIRLGDSWFQSVGRRISHSQCCLSFPGRNGFNIYAWCIVKIVWVFRRTSWLPYLLDDLPYLRHN